ncbi:hypothetical protein D7Y13_04025 [Corallococcus praedator]|uniref:Uncharacterized protein n=1 Tax=Corallococcus praedator TaxID=2316724 RepID=A0ABX9QPW8_9BACT|nr:MULTISPECIES: hypothetical protein [Corallococcus]RKH16604.1 hypothetical protein D7X74_14930 [Corallococcus sp. CA047B]RKH34439.1 hypothetical protein D7X75_08305 [Corallococcus sp. CA031C]RKI15508.1 hypothetical protein D7Y13_04025 [Corallococcus praedator]
MDQDTGWSEYASGSTLGGEGSQGGIVVRDEGHRGGNLRLTYEADDARSFHSITSGIAGWLRHPRFFDNADAAARAFEEMKPALEELGAKLSEGGPRSTADGQAAGPLLAAFVVRFS